MTTSRHVDTTQIQDRVSAGKPSLAEAQGFWLNDWWVAPEHHTLTLMRAAGRRDEFVAARPSNHLDAICKRTLEPRLMKLLCRLAEQPGRVVSRETLVEHLWPRVIVNDNSLTRAVSDLRKALCVESAAAGDAPGAQGRPVRIETIPKRGYSLRASVTVPRDVGQAMPGVQDTTVRDGGSFTQVAGAQNTRGYESIVSFGWRWLPAAAATILLVGNIAIEMVSLQSPEPATPVAASQPAAETSGSSSASLLDEVRKNQALPTRQTAATVFDSIARDTITDNELVGGASSLQLNPSPLLWESDQHDLPMDTAALTPLTMLAPDGHLIAYVEKQGDISSLKLRPAFADSTETWVAFTTDEQITSMQWSPLGDGILFTVVNQVLEASGAAYMRLMLLDMSTLALHELYRKPVNPVQLHEAEQSGKLT